MNCGHNGNNGNNSNNGDYFQGRELYPNVMHGAAEEYYWYCSSCPTIRKHC